MLEEEEIKKVSHAMVQLGTLEVADRREADHRVRDEARQQRRHLVELRAHRGAAPEDLPERPGLADHGGDQGCVRQARLGLDRPGRPRDPRLVPAQRVPADGGGGALAGAGRPRRQVLTILPEDFAIDCLNRMLRMETVQKEALSHIEETLRIEFVSHHLRRRSGATPHEMMAESSTPSTARPKAASSPRSTRRTATRPSASAS